MYIPETYFGAIILMFISMVCWGSWANTTKIDKKWRFELYYWDYALGVLFMSILLGVTMGSAGDSGLSFFPSIAEASKSACFKAFFSGAIFNVANILLVGAITLVGMAVAIPVGIGIALVFGTLLSYFVHPEGNAFAIFLGVFLILVAVILDGIAYRRASHTKGGLNKKGLILALIAGILMSLFYPIIADSMIGARSLTPYSAVFFFSIGLFVSNLIINAYLMRKPVAGKELTSHDYMKGTKKQHLYGFIGGIIWCIGMTFNVIASTHAGPAIAYSFGQGSTLVAAIWGVFVWHEFKHAKKVTALLFFMFLAYVLGLLAIGIAKNA